MVLKRIKDMWRKSMARCPARWSTQSFRGNEDHECVFRPGHKGRHLCRVKDCGKTS